MEARLVTDGKRYRVQVKGWFGWKLFLYGFNEGGGRYFIEEGTPGKAWEKFQECMPGPRVWVPISNYPASAGDKEGG